MNTQKTRSWRPQLNGGRFARAVGSADLEASPAGLPIVDKV
jgi:hypothetical protein